MNILGVEVRAAGFRAPVLKIARRAAPRPPLLAVDANRGGWWPIVREPFAGAWQRNVDWRPEEVSAHHAVFACKTRMSQDIGKLRPKLVEQDPATGIWREVTARTNPYVSVLAKPNHFQNHIQFKESWQLSKLSTGNTYVLKQRDGARRVSALYVLDPTRVTVLVAPDGAVFYQLVRDDLSQVGESVTVPASEIVHDRINCLFHPLVGVSPIYACGTAANVGLQIERNSSGFFGNGSNPSGILTSPQNITKTKADELSAIWESQYGAGNSGRVAVLGNDMKFTAMRMSAVDSQLIEQLGWSATTVCSAFHVPPFKLGIGPMPAYTNPEIASTLYYTDCLQAPIEQWELCMDEAFGFQTPTEGRMLGVELDLDGLLRMDSATQMKTLTEGVKGSVLTVNGARRKIDEPPVPGGDTVYMQQQNYSLEALDARDRENPLAPPSQPKPAEPAPPPPADDAPPDDEFGAARAERLRVQVNRRARLLRIRAIAA